MSDAALRALEEALPEGILVTDPDVVDAYRRDRATTVQPGTPLALVRATSTADVQATLRVAHAHGIPVVPRGAGTGLSGGSSAIDGAITLSTERMRAIEVDPQAMVAVVQPGLLNAEVKAAAREHGLWYPPDPSSFEICSIGGNLATNAGGLCCVKYGVTTDYVLGIEVVLADGRALRLGGRTIKDVAGYDLKRLFIGSEGTLGVITEATLRLRPLPPPATTIVGTFADVVAAGRAVTATVTAVRPAALELMDAAAVAAVEAVRPMGLDPGIGALLLAQVDGGGRRGGDRVGGVPVRRCHLRRRLRRPRRGRAAHGGPAHGHPVRRAARHGAHRGHQRARSRASPISWPPWRRSRVRHATAIPVIGHAGDGNLHPLVTFDASDPDATDRAEAAFDDIMWAALDLGGTVTGEHGDRHAQGAPPRPPARPRRDGAHARGEGRPRPHGHPQPRKVGLTSPAAGP